jgi:hypothetical protein
MLTSVPYGVEWSGSFLGCVTASERDPSVRLIVWVGLRADLGVVEKGRKSFLCACQELNPGHVVHSSVTILTEVPQFLIVFHIS